MPGPPRARIALALVCLSTLAAATAVAAPRVHRTTLPPPATPPRLPTSLGVDEGEWLVVPSKKVVAAGEVSFHVNNRGMDDHDFTIVDGTGTLRQIYLAPGTNGDRARHPHPRALPHLLLAVRRDPRLPRGPRDGELRGRAG